MEVFFCDKIDDEKITYVVIISKYQNKWVFCRHKARDSYEIPGGKRECEDLLSAAKRELYEETGALKYELRPFGIYAVKKELTTYGMIYFADILEFENELKYEIEEIIITDTLPKRWTYPEIQPLIIMEYIRKNKRHNNRCFWCNINNPLYVKYHDFEFGHPNFNDEYLFEMLVLESFQAGLSWECVLNKRAAFKQAFDQFKIEKIIDYDEEKINELMQNKDIIRNKRKIISTILNAQIFCKIINEYGSFYQYLNHFVKNEIIVENDKTSSPLSDMISSDLYKRGMRFVGTKIIYSFLQAIGIIYSHDDNCFMHLM